MINMNTDDIRNDLKEDMSDIVDDDTELEGYDKGWRVGYNMGVAMSFQKNKENVIKIIKHLNQTRPRIEDFYSSKEMYQRVTDPSKLRMLDEDRFWSAVNRHDGKVEILIELFNITHKDLK